MCGGWGGGGFSYVLSVLYLYVFSLGSGTRSQISFIYVMGWLLVVSAHVRVVVGLALFVRQKGSQPTCPE